MVEDAPAQRVYARMVHAFSAGGLPARGASVTRPEPRGEQPRPQSSAKQPRARREPRSWPWPRRTAGGWRQGSRPRP
jgi:hypothetical protein